MSARILGTSCFYPPNHRIHNAYWRWDDPGPALLEGAKEAVRRAIGHLLKTKEVSACRK
jgi:hypothetical protein